MKLPFVTSLIVKLAPEIGARVHVEPEFGFVGQIIFRNGRQSFFRNARLDINPQGAMELARDKAYASLFLNRFGYPTPLGQTFFSDELCRKLASGRDIDEGYAFAQEIGFPVIVKPNNLAQGRLVAKVFDRQEYTHAAREIFRAAEVLLVQKFYEGKDYRIVVFDGEVVTAYQRHALAISGDGRSTIARLIDKKLKILGERLSHPNIDAQDFRIRTNLERHGFHLEDILEQGATLSLLDNANLSLGGEAREVRETMHADFKRLAVSITRDMGLRFCGVDIISADITLPLGQQRDGSVVLEINGAPGLDNYAALGTEQRQIVEDLYLRILQAIEREHYS